MGYMLLNERMLETYLHAKKWMKPEGKMFPSRGDLHVAPFTDEALYMEQINKVNFWYQDYFHGVHLSSLRDAALKEYFRQPIVSSRVTWSICHHNYRVTQKVSDQGWVDLDLECYTSLLGSQ